MPKHAFYLSVEMTTLDDTFPAKCWKPDCNEFAVFIFYFLETQFSTCPCHAEEFLEVLKETYRRFLMTKESGAK